MYKNVKQSFSNEHKRNLSNVSLRTNFVSQICNEDFQQLVSRYLTKKQMRMGNFFTIVFFLILSNLWYFFDNDVVMCLRFLDIFQSTPHLNNSPLLQRAVKLPL
jgi:hypothetical protein